MAKNRKKLLALITAGTIIGGGYFATRGELVTEVIDGDSFKLKNNQTIRLSSLNAPEKDNCLYEESKLALTKKILNKRVVLQDQKTDIYRRILALVYVNGTLVNEYMIRNGLASTTRQAGDETAAIKLANDYARANKLGVYSPECFQTTPPNPNCSIKGNIDDRSQNKEYLTSDCPDYSKTIVEKSFGEDWYCTEDAARKDGFVKSSSCDRR